MECAPVVLVLCWVGCVPKTAAPPVAPAPVAAEPAAEPAADPAAEPAAEPAADPAAEPADVEASDDDGPIAGPRSVVEQAPPEPLPPDTPGGGPLVPYVSKVRKVVTVELARCLGDVALPPATRSLLVTPTIGPDGALRDLAVGRSSGDEAYDGCVVRSFRAVRLPIPPAAEVGEAGVVVLPEMAFPAG